MRTLRTLVLSAALLSTASCTTLNESIQLGGSIGAAGGAAATSIAYRDAGVRPDSDTLLTGAAIGMAVGLITSYITHKEVELKRITPAESPEAYFGDLPPNPFVVPQTNMRGGR